MAVPVRRLRRAKGVNFVDLIKILKLHRRKVPLEGLSPRALALFDEHILASDWYPHDLLLELLAYTYKHLLGENEDNALEMGLAGAKIALTTFHRAFVKKGDPLASALAMRHTWSSYFDFGALHADADGKRAVRFAVTDYADVPAFHGLMIAGWHMTAPQLAGATKVTCEWLEQPWKGAERMLYVVRF